MTDKQKKLLGFGGVGAAGLLLYRHMHSGATTTRTATPVTNSSATGSITPFVPQAPLTLQPGESVYDPNSQNLLTTPTPIDTTGNVPGNGSQTVAAAGPSYSVNVTYPQTVRTVRQTVKPTKRAAAKKSPKTKKKAAA